MVVEDSEKNALLDTIEDLVQQFAGSPDGDPTLYDSMALSALADAMQVLADNGRMTIVSRTGRRVFARSVRGTEIDQVRDKPHCMIST
jgi:hypothetical protein